MMLEKGVEEKTFYLNLGPQHPSTHGVLRIVLEMDGEYIVNSDPVIGYGHRAHEKMAENRNYQQFLPNMGRVDYLHALAYQPMLLHGGGETDRPGGAGAGRIYPGDHQ